MAGTGRVPLEAALVRVWRGNTPVGAGFLAGPREVLTAAHVVADALGVPADGARPDERLDVDFPLLDPDRRIPAVVVAWAPVDERMRGDVAGLRLLAPPPDGAAPLVLVRADGATSDQLIMVGFPRGLELGSWVYGRRGGRVATGWVEINSEPGREATLDPGFSGSPVWAPELDAAVGMVAQRVRGAPPKIGYFITVDMVLSAWPELVDVIERRPPFRALRPFTEEDSDLFFGRAEEAELLARLARTQPVVCVVGPSGVGKSSLLHAGVVPLLRAEPGQVVTVLRPTDGSTPVRALAAAFDRLINPDAPVGERLDRVDGLARRLTDGGVTDVVAAALDRQGGDRLLVAVDQFEEIFDAPEPAQNRFTQVLRATLAPRARWSILLNLRDTFLGTSLRNPAVIELAGRWHAKTVSDLTTAQLRAAITGPLSLVGTVSYQDGLVERLLDDVQSAPSSLPLLQFTLAELWARRTGGLLRHDAYDDLGGVRGALAGYADDVWSGLAPSAQADAARLLLQLMSPVPDSELWVRRTAHQDELDDAQWAIAQRLAGTRLLVLRGAPRAGVELAHESLLEHWRQPRQLAKQFRDFRAWQENLRQRMATWTEEKKASRRLLSGLDLREANRWARRQPTHLSAAERGYLALSRKRRGRRWAVAAVVLTVVLAVVATTYRTTGRQRADLAAKNLAETSNKLAPFDGYGAAQLALRAYRTNSAVKFDRSPQDYPGVDSLLPDYTTTRLDRSPPTPAATSTGGTDLRQISLAFDLMSGRISAGGTRLVTTNSAGQVVVWTVDGDRVRSTPLTNLFNDNDLTLQATISRSGRYVAFLESVWGLPIPTDVNAPVDDEGLPKVNPDDFPTCALTSIKAAGTTCLVVYDLQARRVTTAVPLGGATTFVSMISIDPDDQVVAAVMPGSRDTSSTGAGQNTVRRWDLRSGRERPSVRLPWHSWLTGMWLRPGGSSAVVEEAMLTSAGTRAERLALSVADLGSTPRRRELAAHINDAEMSLDGHTVGAIETTADGAQYGVTAWNVATGEVVTHVTGLSADQANGRLTLNRDGTVVALSWQIPLDPSPPTDIEKLDLASRGLAMWSLPDGRALPVPEHGQSPWGRVVPLGDGVDGPLALNYPGVVGLVLPHAGQDPPLRRFAAAAGVSRIDDVMDRLCTLLADPNNDKAVRDFVPPDASKEPLCPS